MALAITEVAKQPFEQYYQHIVDACVVDTRSQKTPRFIF